MGLLALHVAFQGDHPTFFYGLPYMAPLEGYIAAPLFRIFGVSLFTLRIGLLPLFAAFLICMYYLTRLLYTEKFALAIVILLSLGSYAIIYLQIKAVGEYPETELFFALIPLLASWLALTSHSFIQREARRSRQKRILIYGFLGLIVGLALWVDFLILPIVAIAALLLLLFCYQELLSWKGLILLLGVIVGAFPLILYNLTAPLESKFFVYSSMDSAGRGERNYYSTPDMAAPYCWYHDDQSPRRFWSKSRLPSLPLFRFMAHRTLQLCHVSYFTEYGASGYLILLIVATSCAVRAVWQSRHSFLFTT